MVEFERDKNFGILFLAKLKTAITFTPGIRMNITIYAFGVEENFPCRGNRPEVHWHFKLEKSAVY